LGDPGSTPTVGSGASFTPRKDVALVGGAKPRWIAARKRATVTS
jgi:hypothetical protein